MASTVTTQTPFNPNTTYAGACSSTLVYFQASGGSAPTGCIGMSSFSTSYQKCQSAVNSLIDPGFYTDQFLQWKYKSPKFSWANTIVSGANRYEVACKGDYSSMAPFPTTYNGTTNSAANEWTNTANAASSYWAQNGASGGGYTLYSANYLNYLASNPPTVSGTRISVVQQAATNLIDRKSTRLNSSHSQISYAVFCLKKKKEKHTTRVRHHQSVICRCRDPPRLPAPRLRSTRRIVLLVPPALLLYSPDCLRLLPQTVR